MRESTVGAGAKEMSVVSVAAELGGERRLALSGGAERSRESTILKIAEEIRERKQRGEQVLDLTIGDFRPDQFPVPATYCERIREALREGHTNYPPVAGLPEMREAVRDHVRKDLGLEYPTDGVLIGGGARPLIYSSFMAFVDPGDLVLYPVPSWNSHHYVNLSGARGLALPVTAAKNFHLDHTDLAPHLAEARLLCLNSPLNPTGTCISREALTGICRAIVTENERRSSAGERPLFLIYDQVYNLLTFGKAEHFTPVHLVPEVAPYAILIDAVSKGFCGTGLRVGWGIGPPPIIKKMASMAGHYGAWCPRPQQVGTARFLRDRAAIAEHRKSMVERLEARLGLLDRGLGSMRMAGMPVEHIEPQGAIYLSVRFALHGRNVKGRLIETNEDIRALLLEEAGFAVVPFDAFGHEGEPGWMRLSVGAAAVEEIEAGLDRVRAVLEPAG
jgi:aspartate aminotransferase